MGRGSDEAFRDLLGLHEKMCRLFDDQAGRVRGDREAMTAHWSPPVDIYETAAAFVLAAEVPGIEEDEIHLEISEDVLVLRGERPSHTRQPSHSYHRIERPDGSFQRLFRLPAVVDPQGVRASYREGVLWVNLPKREEGAPKPIPVKVEP